MKLVPAGLLAWARRLKLDVIALWIAARDERTPLMAKIVAGAVAAYALSPIDLIPDFLPIIGLLDDLVIVPAGIWLAVRLIPPKLFAEFRQTARARLDRPTSRVAAAVIAVIWAVTLAFCVLVTWHLFAAHGRRSLP